MKLTETQMQRLSTLGSTALDGQSFESAQERDAAFRAEEKRMIKASRAQLRSMQEAGEPALVSALAAQVSEFLRQRGFMELSTPIIISKAFLERMSIDDSHALNDQVFWLDGKSCLRPMLACGLYDASRRLIEILGTPLSVFEVGPCFRKESRGSRHLECFTMVNFVEWGIPEEEKQARVDWLVSELMAELGLEYQMVEEDSTVYGKTFDVEVDGVELASGAFGPHPLDPAWGIATTWLGLGMGLERAVCLQQGIDNVQRVGRSLVYHNGVSLNFK